MLLIIIDIEPTHHLLPLLFLFLLLNFKILSHSRIIFRTQKFFYQIFGDFVLVITVHVHLLMEPFHLANLKEVQPSGLRIFNKILDLQISRFNGSLIWIIG